jgi:flagellar biosynthesis protein FliQ
MTQETVLTLGQGALVVLIALAAPSLLLSLVVGLLVSVFQAVTSIQEQTLSFIPKILVIGAVLAIGGPWMLDQMLTYTQNLYGNIPNLVGP